MQKDSHRKDSNVQLTLNSPFVRIFRNNGQQVFEQHIGIQSGTQRNKQCRKIMDKYFNSVQEKQYRIGGKMRKDDDIMEDEDMKVDENEIR